jgi:two-component system, LytTR family, response regulator
MAVDDEKFALDFLEDNIKRVPYLHLMAKCKNAFEAGHILQSEQIDLIILDIQMPGLDGLEFVKRQFPRPLIIFITAYENYAVEAFNVEAIDYLVKPVAFERFLQATNKALLFFSYNQSLIHNNLLNSDPEFIFINVEYNLVRVVLSDVLYIEGLKDYIRIHLCSSKRALLTRVTLKGMQELLPERKFLRIHRSFIVAMSAIAVIKKDSVLLVERNIELPISEGYKDSINRIIRKK